MTIISFPPSPSSSPSAAIPPLPRSLLIHRHSSSSSSSSLQPPQPNKSTVTFSPPLIAMVVIVATAFLAVSYSRLLSRHLLRLRHRVLRRHRRLPTSSAASSSSPPFMDSPPSDGFRVYSPYGLDEGVIKTLPLSLFTCSSSRAKDCAVCLLEFERGHDYVRTLPNCAHSFHVDCIDMWLRSHANCPICRAGIFSSSPFTPLMAARIRPNIDDDDVILNDLIIFEEIDASPDRGDPNASILNNYGTSSSHVTNTEIIEEELARPREFILKRSYSFGCEKGSAAVSLVDEAVTVSPWRWRRGWRRMSPFGMIGKGSSAGRAFSLRYSHHGQYRRSSPVMFRRLSGVFFPLSESRSSIGWRRGKFVGSPMMPVGGGGRWSSASRLRCGDPEALLSPDRFSRRR